MLKTIDESDLAVIDLTGLTANVKWEIEQAAARLAKDRIQFIASSQVGAQAVGHWIRESAPESAARAFHDFGVIEYGDTRGQASRAFWLLFWRMRRLACSQAA